VLQKAAHWYDRNGEQALQRDILIPSLQRCTPRLSESSALRGTRHWSPRLCMHLIFKTGFQCLRFHKAINEFNYASHWKDKWGHALQQNISFSVSPVRSESLALRGTRHWSPGLCTHSIISWMLSGVAYVSIGVPYYSAKRTQWQHI
jgi:hypothetical protein